MFALVKWGISVDGKNSLMGRAYCGVGMEAVLGLRNNTSQQGEAENITTTSGRKELLGKVRGYGVT